MWDRQWGWMMVAVEQPWQSHLSTKLTTGEQRLCGIEKGGWTTMVTKQPWEHKNDLHDNQIKFIGKEGKTLIFNSNYLYWSLIHILLNFSR